MLAAPFQEGLAEWGAGEALEAGEFLSNFGMEVTPNFDSFSDSKGRAEALEDCHVAYDVLLSGWPTATVTLLASVDHDELDSFVKFMHQFDTELFIRIDEPEQREWLDSRIAEFKAL